MRPTKWLTVFGTVAVLAALVPAAHADTITLSATGTGGGGPESAAVTITTSTNQLLVVLSSSQINPTAAGQEVSGIFFTLSGTPSSVSLLSTAGTLINIAPGGSVTPYVGPITHWGTGLTGSTICLETAGSCAVGGKPIDLIIGSGSFTAANPSITGRNPQIEGAATFTLMAPGVTASTKVTGVTFEFGTGPDSSLAVPVPEPSSLSMLTIGLGLVAMLGLRRKRTLQHQA